MTYQQNIFSSATQPILWSLRPENSQRSTHAPSKTVTTTDLIDFRRQFNNYSRSQLFCQIISRFERCNSPCFIADGYRWQRKSLSTIKGIIRAVMKKSQRAHLTVMETCNIRTLVITCMVFIRLNLHQAKGKKKKGQRL